MISSTAYMATVIVISDGHSLRIEACHRNQSNNRGGGSSFTLVRQILQTWTYMCGKQGYPQDLENMMYKSYCA